MSPALAVLSELIFIHVSLGMHMWGEQAPEENRRVCALQLELQGCCELSGLGTGSKLISHGRTGSSVLNHRAIRAAQFSKSHLPAFVSLGKARDPLRLHWLLA